MAMVARAHERSQTLSQSVPGYLWYSIGLRLGEGLQAYGASDESREAGAGGDVSFLGRREATATESFREREWRRQNLDN